MWLNICGSIPLERRACLNNILIRHVSSLRTCCFLVGWRAARPLHSRLDPLQALLEPLDVLLAKEEANAMSAIETLSDTDLLPFTWTAHSPFSVLALGSMLST